MSRRDMLRGAAIASAATATSLFACAPAGRDSSGAAQAGRAVRNGRIRQAICGWPYMVFGEVVRPDGKVQRMSEVAIP